MKRRAIFLDRDGTINLDAGYITAAEQFRLYDFAAPAIRRLNEAGWVVIVVTNQAGIARGVYTEEFLAGLHETMVETLRRDGARLDAIYHCPHYQADDAPARNPTGCGCRKPEPGMLHRAAREHGLALHESWMIGDRYRDLAAGYGAGTRAILVRTGHGAGEYEREHQTWPRQPEHVAEDLDAAVEWILAAEPIEKPDEPHSTTSEEER